MIGKGPEGKSSEPGVGSDGDEGDGGTRFLMRSTFLRRYGLAMLAVALAFGIKRLIDPLIVQDTPTG